MSRRSEPVPFRLVARSWPWWLSAIFGLVVSLLGLALITRPFASVAWLLLLLGIALVLSGISEFARPDAWPGLARWLRRAFAVLQVAAGAALLCVPGVTLRVVVWIVGVTLLLQGVRELWAAVTEREARWANALGGAAAQIFGVLAFSWPDMTVLAIGALFGVWLIVRGVRLLLDSWAARHEGEQARDQVQGSRRASRRSALRTVLSALAFVIALLLAVVGGKLVGTQAPDEFYTAPSQVPSEPGTLLRAEAFTRGMPEGSTAWRLLYTTTRAEGEPAIASALVVVPNGVADAPVIAWAHGTTGAAVGCAPSLLDEPFVAGAMPNVDEVIAAGWAVVATDYVGLGADAPHPYLVGEAAARSVLDAVRASYQLQEAALGDEVVVWGHSQGGGAALWTGGLSESYAPELEILGVAAMAPAANLPAMIEELAFGVAGAVVGPLALAGYAAQYDDVRVSEYLRPQATLLYEETIARCWSDPAMLVTIVGAGLIDGPIWSKSPVEGVLGERLKQNVPTRPIAAPLLIAQGLSDTLVMPAAQQEYVDSLCAAGQRLDYRTYEGKDHMGLVTGDSPLLGELMEWTEARLRSEPLTASTCS